MHKERDAMGNMKIDRTNYEEFIIGYLDGTLDPVRTAELLIFLEQNPDLKEEANDLALISLKPESGITYDFKDVLLKPADTEALLLNTSNYNHYFIAAHEGDLSPAGMKAVESFIEQNPALLKEYQLYGLSRLKPDENVVFGNGSSLRKPVKASTRTLFYYSAAAAGVLLLISVFLRLDPGTQNPLAESFMNQANPPRQASVSDSANTGTTRKTPAGVPGRQAVKPPVVKEKKSTQPTAAKPSGSVNDTRNNGEINKIPVKHYINKTPEPFNGGSRNFYSALYDDILKSQEPMLASLEPVNGSANRLPMAGTRSVKRLNNLIRTGAQIVSQMPGSLNGWMLADLGIEGFNMLTDNDIEFQRVVKPNGQTDKVIISGNRSGYEISRKNN